MNSLESAANCTTQQDRTGVSRLHKETLDQCLVTQVLDDRSISCYNTVLCNVLHCTNSSKCPRNWERSPLEIIRTNYFPLVYNYNRIIMLIGVSNGKVICKKIHLHFTFFRPTSNSAKKARTDGVT